MLRTAGIQYVCGVMAQRTVEHDLLRYPSASVAPWLSEQSSLTYSCILVHLWGHGSVSSRAWPTYISECISAAMAQWTVHHGLLMYPSAPVGLWFSEQLSLTHLHILVHQWGHGSVTSWAWPTYVSYWDPKMPWGQSHWCQQQGVINQRSAIPWLKVLYLQF